ncbi:MAG: DUF47 family protein [Bacteroidales bacterium]|nr:DUF47 family protein [Bacteroidales bacterium]MDD4669732.1 DUF47 family protein [Bacteroidales bacterium]
MFSLKKTNYAIENIDKFFDTIDQALLIFKAGVKDYLYSNREDFNKNIETMSQLETDAGILRREIESNLYTQSVLVRFRGDIMRLLESMDHIMNILNNSLFQFEIELPFIPSELNNSFMKLTELSTLSVESAIPAAKAYFRNPDTITEKIHRVYFYEKETNKQAQAIKRHVFHDMHDIKLSEKFHLRYFALHIEDLSDAAEKVADQLSVMSIKRGL